MLMSRVQSGHTSQSQCNRRVARSDPSVSIVCHPGEKLFWDYNPHRRGPKRKETNISNISEIFINFVDPISGLGGQQSQKRLRLRKGEGNDPKPNIVRFLKVRSEMKALKHEYKDSNGKISPKERNKLASRICRLKKKAFHDSTKIKYALLSIEYEELNFVLSYLRYVSPNTISRQDLVSWISASHETCVAGRLDEAINEMVAGEDSGREQHHLVAKLERYNRHGDYISTTTNPQCSTEDLRAPSTLSAIDSIFDGSILDIF